MLDPVSELSAAAPGRGTLIYTDGSVKGDEVGAGYVVPPPWTEPSSKDYK